MQAQARGRFQCETGDGLCARGALNGSGHRRGGEDERDGRLRSQHQAFSLWLPVIWSRESDVMILTEARRGDAAGT
jgi:hypothetical protein